MTMTRTSQLRFTLARLGLPVVPALLLACAASSRRPVAPSVAMAPTTALSVSPPRPVASSTNVDAGRERAHLHLISLPPRWFDQETGYQPHIDMAPGEMPSAEHPAGTVFVAESRVDRPKDAVTVSEWDLATGSELREAPLPVPPDDGDVWMVRDGARLHLMAWAFNQDIEYACMTTDLKPVHAERIGDVSAGGPAAITSDGGLALLLADGILGSDPRRVGSGQEGFFAATFDSNGRRIAARVIEKPHSEGDGAWEYSAPLRHTAVVAGHRAYVLLATADHQRFRLVRLRPDLSVERDTTLQISGDVVSAELTLSAVSNRLVLDSGPYVPSPFRILFTLDPTELARGRPCPSTPPPGGEHFPPNRDVWLGRVHAALYGMNRGKVHIAWTETDPPDPAAPVLCAADSHEVPAGI
jgi:hypothetical protein